MASPARPRGTGPRLRGLEQPQPSEEAPWSVVEFRAALNIKLEELQDFLSEGMSQVEYMLQAGASASPRSRGQDTARTATSDRGSLRPDRQSGFISGNSEFLNDFSQGDQSTLQCSESGTEFPSGGKTSFAVSKTLARQESRASSQSMLSFGFGSSAAATAAASIRTTCRVDLRNNRFHQLLSQSAFSRRRHQSPAENIGLRWRTDPLFPFFLLDSASAVIVLLNTVLIGVGQDVVPEWRGWLAIDTVFAVLFTAELILKIMLCRSMGKSFWHGSDRWWNVFELCLVLIGIAEVVVEFYHLFSPGTETSSNYSLLRMLRIMRIGRIVRMARLSLFAELTVMLKSAFGGSKALFWALILICVPIYIVAIVFSMTLGTNHDNGAELFVNVRTAFFTLFRCVVSKECTDQRGRPIFLLVARHHGWAYSALFCAIDYLMTFGLFNVIIALFIENVLAKAKQNESMLRRRRLSDDMYFSTKMAALILEVLDAKEELDGSSGSPRGSPRPSSTRLASDVDSAMVIKSAGEVEISPVLMNMVLNRPGVTEILHDLDIADEDQLRLFETLDADGNGSIDITELFEGIAKLRGIATRSDVIALNLMLQKIHDDLISQGDMTEQALGKHEHALQVVRTAMRSARHSVDRRTSHSAPPESEPR